MLSKPSPTACWVTLLVRSGRKRSVLCCSNASLLLVCSRATSHAGSVCPESSTGVAGRQQLRMC